MYKEVNEQGSKWNRGSEKETFVNERIHGSKYASAFKCLWIGNQKMKKRHPLGVSKQTKIRARCYYLFY